MPTLDITESNLRKNTDILAKQLPIPAKKPFSTLKTKARVEPYEACDLIVDYLQQLGIEFVFGVPGGAIEPLYNALARSERKGGVRAVVARHESGAGYMADGYARNSGKLGVCCSTTGPGATNMITGVATAYENNIPMLAITAQTAVTNFGRKALQESADTGVNTVGMFEFCTVYNTLVSHVDQLEQKLMAAIMTAFGPTPGPAHLSIPLDILRTRLKPKKPAYDILSLIKTSAMKDDVATQELTELLKQSKKVVFVLGGGASEAAEVILRLAHTLEAEVVTTPDGKGLINPYHSQFRGVIGFAGHSSAEKALLNEDVDLVVAIGSTLGEWASSGWDKNMLLNNRLVHVESAEVNLTRSPMARLHVRGRILAIFEKIVSDLAKQGMQFVDKPKSNPLPQITHFEVNDPIEYFKASEPIKPQWLMRQITNKFPTGTKYIADSGNSFAWAIHYLHPYDRRISQRRLREGCDAGRRTSKGGSFQAAIEFAPMGWAIGSAVGAGLACKRNHIVCFTGDGSWLMSGQEITTAAQNNLSITYVILNDSALGMVKHGQKLAGAEPTAFELPEISYADMAKSVGANGYTITTCQEFLDLEISTLISSKCPNVIDVRIDPDQVPPMGIRMKVLGNKK